MNKTALITGASKRIGKSIAQFLAQNGWNVIIHFNNAEKSANSLVNELQLAYSGQQFSCIKANLAEISEVEKLIPEIVKKSGAFQLLINNASVFEKNKILETNPAFFDRQFDVNFKAPFFLMRDFALFCKAGNIINFVDTRITTNNYDFAAYSLSKKALWESTKMAALELAPKIRVNAIAPGVTLAPAEKKPEYLEKLAQKIAMKKPGGIEPILKSVDFILENKHLTGQLLFADGGENLGKLTP